jgi:hypothetical protein
MNQPAAGSTDNKILVDECVERVLEILRQREDR